MSHDFMIKFSFTVAVLLVIFVIIILGMAFHGGHGKPPVIENTDLSKAVEGTRVN